MFGLGRIVGEVLAAPIRVANIPVKLAQKAAEVVDPISQYQAPRKNALDKVADAVSDSCQEALERD